MNILELAGISHIYNGKEVVNIPDLSIEKNHTWKENDFSNWDSFIDRYGTGETGGLFQGEPQFFFYL